MDSRDEAPDASLKGPHAPMPPVTSQPIGTPRSGLEADRMAAPFTGQPTFGARMPQPAPVAALNEPEDMRWAEMSDEGIVEPAFEADVSETEAALAALSQVTGKADEDFPLDAFIIPEHSRRLPTGLAADAVSAEPSHTPVTDLADKLEKLSHRLRVEDADAVISKLATGDKLDTMLAGLLAGYVAGTK